jgi:hypothetical protein
MLYNLPVDALQPSCGCLTTFLWMPYNLPVDALQQGCRLFTAKPWIISMVAATAPRKTKIN